MASRERTGGSSKCGWKATPARASPWSCTSARARSTAFYETFGGRRDFQFGARPSGEQRRDRRPYRGTPAHVSLVMAMKIEIALNLESAVREGGRDDRDGRPRG